MAGRLIGIDLGTTNSCACVMEGGEARVIPNREGSRTTPSVVAFTDAAGVLVGHVAKRQGVTNPQRTFFGVKRLIGQPFEAPRVREARRRLPYPVVAARNGDAWLRVGARDYAPPEISALVLRALKQAAETYLREPVVDAVVTVPAYFDDAQRQATKDAGRIAGLNVLRILNEPTAAALAYGLDKRRLKQVLGVYDFGGGTFDFTLLEMNDGVFEVLATSGDTFLGGEDVDQLIQDWLVARFQVRAGLDLSSHPMSTQRLREAAEKAKCELSSVEAVDIRLPFIAQGPEGPVHLEERLTRAELEAMADGLVAQTLGPIRDALAAAGRRPEQLDEVILVGGQTRMPLVRRLVRNFFGREPNRSLNPDEVVAMGAAVQGAMLQGEVRDMVLLDVTPLSLGIETQGGGFARIISRNATIPTRGARTFTTVADEQSRVEVHVLQGERELAEHNRSLARFELLDLPALPRGVPQIEVSFDIDSNGIVKVSARDLMTGVEQVMNVRPSSGLPASEVERLVQEAEAHQAADLTAREALSQIAAAEGLVFACDKAFVQWGKFLPSDQHASVRETLLEARQAIARRDLPAVRACEEGLGRAQALLTKVALAEGHAVISLLEGESEDPKRPN